MESTVAKNFPWSAGLARLIWPEGPARRKRWVVAAGVLLLLVLLHTAWIVIASARLDRVIERVGERWETMSLTSLAPPAVADRDNAARPVRAASELLELPEPVAGRRIVVRSYGSFEASEAPADELEMIRSSVADNALTLKVLDEAIARPTADWGVPYREGVSADIPELVRLLDLAKLNAAAGRLALRDGRIADLVAAIERGAAIERSLAHEPLTIIQVVGASAQRYPVALLRDWLVRGDADPDSLESLTALWMGRPRGNPLESAMANEAKAMAKVMLDGTPRASDSTIVAVLVRLARPYVIDNVRVYLERMELVTECATQPRHERDPRCSDDRDTEAFGRYHVMARTMVLDFAATFDRIDVADSRAALAIVAIALERYRLRHDAYPDTLAALAPDWLPSVPVDPLTGGPFSYGRTDRGYRLTTAAVPGELLSRWPQHDLLLNWVVER